MPEYREYTQTIEIPKGTGTKGFLRAIEEILKLDRVQGVSIDARGQVTYTRFVREDEEGLDIGPRLNFEALMPWAVVRNGHVIELTLPPSEPPTMSVARMFSAVSGHRLFPSAFVTGANTTLFEWLKGHQLEVPDTGEFFGLPVLRDRMIEDYVLILAAGYGRSASFSDTQHSFKIIMPQRLNALTGDGNRKGGDSQSRDLTRVPQVGLPSRGANGTGSRNSGGGNSGS